jgi:hypothetical protein
VVYPKVGNVIWASEFSLVRALTVLFGPADKGKWQDQIRTLRVRDRRFGRSFWLSSETSGQCMPFPLNTHSLIILKGHFRNVAWKPRRNCDCVRVSAHKSLLFESWEGIHITSFSIR